MSGDTERPAGPDGLDGDLKVVDLVGFLDAAIDALRANREFATSELLDVVEGAVTGLHRAGDAKAAFCELSGVDMNRLAQGLTAVKQVIDAERKLISDGNTERLVRVLERMKERRLILRLVAALL